MKAIKQLLFGALILTLAACGGGDGGTGGEEQDKTSVSVAVEFPGSFMTPAAITPAAPVGPISDVTSVSVDVFDGATPVGSGFLTQGAGNAWSGSIPDLPMGMLLDFVVSAKNASNVILFTATDSFTLTGNDTLTMTMVAEDDGIAITFPFVGPVTLIDPIDTSAAATVSVAVKGNASEVLSFSFVVDSTGGGSFAPATGTITLAADGLGAIDTIYTAPGTAGTYDHHILVTNEQGNSVRLDFPTNVAIPTTSATINLLWAPAVTTLNGYRTGSLVTWTANVMDDQDIGLLTYLWSFSQTGGTPGASFTVSGANPGVLSGYDQTVTGTISLTLTDGDGLSTMISFSLPAGQFPDTTVVQPGSSPTRKFRWVGFLPNGAISYYSEFVYDANGRISRTVFYDGTGLDGIWFTADDTFFTYSAPSYDANGNQIRSVGFNDAGVDGTWFTGDDVVSSFTGYSYDANGNQTRIIQYQDAGVDGIWFNADDTVSSFTDFSYDANRNQTRIISYPDAGVDGTWFTGDDVVSTYTDYSYDANGDQLSGIFYSDAGGDGTWFTADDTVSSYFENTYDANGNLTRFVFYLDAGVDGTWFTGDDVVSNYSDNSYNASGNLLTLDFFYGPGSDGLWFTGDDLHGDTAEYEEY